MPLPLQYYCHNKQDIYPLLPQQLTLTLVLMLTNQTQGKFKFELLSHSLTPPRGRGGKENEETIKVK